MTQETPTSLAPPSESPTALVRRAALLCPVWVWVLFVPIHDMLLRGVLLALMMLYAALLGLPKPTRDELSEGPLGPGGPGYFELLMATKYGSPRELARMLERVHRAEPTKNALPAPDHGWGTSPKRS